MMDPHINPATGVWDDNYWEKVGKFQQSGGGSTFNYDYAKAAEDAYGELGPYYLRLLTESQGDLNKALSRLTDDYDRGIRNARIENAAQEQEAIRQNAQAKTGIVDNALARGIYQKSAFDPNGGMGIPTKNLQVNQEGFDYSAANRKRSLANYEEEAGIQVGRQKIDLPEEQRRREFAMEQERREKAAALAEQRGAREYQNYSAKLAASPSYV